MKISVILVLDSDRLYAELKGSFQDKRVVKLPKSGGVVYRDSKVRQKLQENRIRQYFYGVKSDLCPQQKQKGFSDVVIYQIGGGPQAPRAALPIGAQSTHDPLRLTAYTPILSISHSILAISFAKTPEDILKSHVAGFVCVNEADNQKKKFMFLCPCSDEWPGKYLVLGSLQHLE